jgi:cytochrome b pre-mRNA-processing protein 3
MAKAFYGRARAYEDSLEEEGTDALNQALARNLYRKTSPNAAQIAAIADYMRTEDRRLEETDMDNLAAGNLMFGPVPAPPEETE